jgi:hypothetical protein
MRRQAKESRDSFDLVILDPDPAFAVAAGSTLLAFKGFQEKCLKCLKCLKLEKPKCNHKNTKLRERERKQDVQKESTRQRVKGARKKRKTRNRRRQSGKRKKAKGRSKTEYRTRRKNHGRREMIKGGSNAHFFFNPSWFRIKVQRLFLSS